MGSSLGACRPDERLAVGTENSLSRRRRGRYTDEGNA